MIDIKGKRILYPLFFIVLSGIIIYNLYHIVDRSQGVRVKAFRQGEGWGYKIFKGERVFVYQSDIPLLPGRAPFPSRKTAVKTGKLFVKRINAGKIPPLTKKDLSQLGIDTLAVQ